MVHLEVVGAGIIWEGRLLCVQRGPSKFDYIGGHWELPGGKIEPGESRTVALERELREELELVVSVGEGDFFLRVEHEYVDFSIGLDVFVLRLVDPKIRVLEHVDHVWCPLGELSTLDWVEADVLVAERLSRVRYT